MPEYQADMMVQAEFTPIGDGALSPVRLAQTFGATHPEQSREPVDSGAHSQANRSSAANIDVLYTADASQPESTVPVPPIMPDGQPLSVEVRSKEHELFAKPVFPRPRVSLQKTAYNFSLRNLQRVLDSNTLKRRTRDKGCQTAAGELEESMAIWLK